MKKIPAALLLISILGAAAYGQSLRLVSPNGGESWPLGATRPITWQAQGYSGTVALILWRNGAKVGAIAQSLPASPASFSWNVGRLADGTQAPAGAGYSVRVRSGDNQLGDASDAPFRIIELSFSEPRLPSVQPGQPGNLPEASGLPDLEIRDVYYYLPENSLTFDVYNSGLAPYDGDLDVRMEVEGPGVHDQSKRIHVSNLASRHELDKESFHCDFFPDPCCHRFRIILEPLRPEQDKQNNVFDGTVFKYVRGCMRLGVQAPVRLRFAHSSKTLACGYYVYDANNTISQGEISANYGAGNTTVVGHLEVPVRNCCGSRTGGSHKMDLLLNVEYCPGGTERTLVFHGNLLDGEVSIPCCGAEQVVSRRLELPIRPGAYYFTILNPISSSWECQVTVRFDPAHFD